MKNAIFKGLVLVILGLCFQGCAGTRQLVPSANLYDKSVAHITIKRTGFIGTGVKVQVHDGDRHIGNLGHSGTMSWDRPAGKMVLTAYDSFARSYFKSLETTVAGGKSYLVQASMLSRKLTLKSGEVAETQEAAADKNIELRIQDSNVFIKSVDHGLVYKKNGAYYVSAGEHTLDLKYSGNNDFTWGQNIYKFNAEPNHYYLIGGYRVGDEYAFTITDGITGEQVQTAVKDKFKDY